MLSYIIIYKISNNVDIYTLYNLSKVSKQFSDIILSNQNHNNIIKYMHNNNPIDILKLYSWCIKSNKKNSLYFETGYRTCYNMTMCNDAEYMLNLINNIYLEVEPLNHNQLQNFRDMFMYPLNKIKNNKILNDKLIKII